MKKKVEKFLIADGNPTILAWGLSQKQKNELIKNNLEYVDQIGFVDNNSLSMMVGELCVNATIALASTLDTTGIINISPYDTKVRYKNFNLTTSIELPLLCKKEKNLVLLDGIGFKFEDLNYEVNKSELKELCFIYRVPAFGIILIDKNQIFPYVYVAATDSLKQESACGSGSIAAKLFTGFGKIVQPTGKSISIQIFNNRVKVSSIVQQITFEERRS